MTTVSKHGSSTVISRGGLDTVVPNVPWIASTLTLKGEAASQGTLLGIVNSIWGTDVSGEIVYKLGSTSELVKSSKSL